MENGGLLTIDKMKSFWVSWANGFLEVGEGYTIGDKRLCTWQDSEPQPIHFLTMSTGFGYNGHWELEGIAGTWVTFTSVHSSHHV